MKIKTQTQTKIANNIKTNDQKNKNNANAK